jgi:hypothetical protein
MKKYLKSLVTVLVVLSVLGLVLFLYLFPTIMVFITGKLKWLFWYCVIIPAVATYGATYSKKQ